MQLKHFFIQDYTGSALPGATCTLYLAGTTTLASGLHDAGGNALDNPMAADENGLLQLAAPDGKYDLKCESGLRVYTLRIQFVDADEQARYIEDQVALVQQYAGLVIDEYEPSVQPTLALNFDRNEHKILDLFGLESKSLTDAVTFARASTATRYNATGVLESVAVDTPRIDYDPVSGECRGLLVEEQRTNLLLQSNLFAWGETTTDGPSETLRYRQNNVASAPDGTQTATKISAATSHVSQRLYVVASGVTLGLPVTYSIYAKAGEYKKVGLRTSADVNDFLLVDLSDGSIISAGNSDNQFVEPVGGGWFRIGFTYTPTVAPVLWVALIDPDVNNVVFKGDGTSGIYVWGAQLEQGSFKTSYIQTGAAQVTRASDVCRVDTMTPWFNPDAGSLVFKYFSEDGRSSSRAIGFVGSSFDDRIIFFHDSSISSSSNGISVHVTKNGASSVVITNIGEIAPGALSKIALSWDREEIILSMNGVSYTAALSGDLPIVTRLSGQVGADVSSVMPASYKNIKYLPRKLEAAELEVITA